MRIIAGKYKKHELLSVQGNTARPTTDFLRETLFNILPDCQGLSFLDLYAGSGSVGFEALSRGADRIVFVEFSQKSLSTIINNVNKLKAKEQCKIIRKKVIPYIRKCEEKFDIIFLDPPYNKQLVNITISEVLNSDIITDEGLIVAEHYIKEKIDSEFQKLILLEKSTRHSVITILRPQLLSKGD